MLVKLFCVLVLFIVVSSPGFSNNYFLVSVGGTQLSTFPVMHDPNFHAENVYSGIDFPTSMAFLAADDILVLEKNEGTVKRIINNTMLDQPLLDFNVGTTGERGALGLAVARNQSKQYIFIYLIEPGSENGLGNSELLHGRLYRYELMNDKPINPKLLLDIPFRSANPPMHYGGKLVIGPDSFLYLIVGDYGGQRTETQNFNRIGVANGTSVIYRISYDGSSVDNILSDERPSNKYYAYGIRNSFGMDFDPITGNLWDTENGDTFGDEVNLVLPGFNSGWARVQGFWDVSDPKKYTTIPDKLYDFGGRGLYSSPQFAWLHPSAGVTAATFLDSEIYGREYYGDLLIGDFHMGNIYRFELTENRTALDLRGVLADKITNSVGELNEVVFGSKFGGIVDMQVGPDGLLYVLSLHQGGDDCRTASEKIPVEEGCLEYDSGIEGTIFKILSSKH